jgi:hypothetical protein
MDFEALIDILLPVEREPLHARPRSRFACSFRAFPDCCMQNWHGANLAMMDDGSDQFSICIKGCYNLSLHLHFLATAHIRCNFFRASGF